jgi:hypothetical protein
MESKTLFMVMVDVGPAAIEDEFNGWYNDEHVPELLRVPGFLIGRRFRVINGQPRYAALYDLADISALSEPLFHQARPAHPKSTPATKRMWPHVRNLRRGTYIQFARDRIAAGIDPTEASHLLLVGVELAPGGEPAFCRWYTKGHLPRLAGTPELLGAGCYTLDPRGTDHKDPPGQGLLLYEFAGVQAADASFGDLPARTNTRNLYERIYLARSPIAMNRGLSSPA